MNCLWIILLLSCFGGCGNNCGCGNNSGRSGDCRDNHDRSGRDGQRNRCRRAVEKAVDECGSERAVRNTLNNRDDDCMQERPCRPETRENNSCDVSGMNPSHWQDFPEVSRSSSSHDDCGCDA